MRDVSYDVLHSGFLLCGRKVLKELGVISKITAKLQFCHDIDVMLVLNNLQGLKDVYA